MKANKAIIFIMVLLMLTGGVAAFHLLTRDQVSEGTVQLIYGEKTYELEIGELEYEQVTGIRMNGKGEEIPVEAMGILLKDVLKLKNIVDYSKIKVVSDDSYSAQLTEEEVKENSKVYLLQEEEGELRLLVFGDTNSKRSVTNVVQIIVE